MTIENPPTALLVIGMAGSGKTTFMQRLNADLSTANKERYAINLDPAVMHVPFSPNIDIRDTVDYKQVYPS
jgi:GTPase SAR1 family protein